MSTLHNILVIISLATGHITDIQEKQNYDQCRRMMDYINLNMDQSNLDIRADCRTAFY